MYALMLLSALWFVGAFGRNVPYWDEWAIVPILAGDKAIDVRWLLSDHNGHRIPLPRLLLLALYKLAGTDFRVGMYFNVFALAVLACTMIWVAKSQRGHTIHADAFFPLILLHWGHFENLLWTWQVTQVIPVILVCGLLLMIVRSGTQLTWGIAVLAGICLILLPLCGIPGLVYVPALALWLSMAAGRQWWPRERHGKWKSLVVWSFAAAALCVVALYLIKYRQLARVPSLDLADSAITALQFLTGGFGPAAEAFWPYSGLVMLGLVLLTAAMLLGVAWRPHFSARPRALGMLLFLVAVTCLAISVGLGRRGYGFTPRYFLLAAPALCCAYYAWGIFYRFSVGRLAQTGLIVLLGFMLPHNFQEGLAYGRAYQAEMAAFQLDLLAGEPISKLLAHHTPSLYPCTFGEWPTWGVVVDEGTDVSAESKFPPVGTKNCVIFHDWLDPRLRSLHRAGIGYFRHLQTAPPVFRELPLSVGPSVVNGIAEEGLTSQDTKDGWPLTLALEAPQFVYGIRVAYTVPANSAGRFPCIQVFWKRTGQNTFSKSQRYFHCWGPLEGWLTVWVYATLDQVAITLHPSTSDWPKSLARIVLLVPERLALH